VKTNWSGKRLLTFHLGYSGPSNTWQNHPAPRTLAELNDHHIIGQTAEFPGFKNDGARQMTMFRSIFAAPEQGV